MNNFVQEVLLPNVPEHAMVLLDCWSGHNAVEGLEQEEGQDIEYRFVPPGTTGLCQPLDVYFFRTHKTFIRHLSNAIKLTSDIILSQRDNILKLVLLTHNQFQAPRFR